VILLKLWTRSGVPKEVVMEEVVSQKEHEWLTKFVGDWTYETESLSKYKDVIELTGEANAG